MALTSHGLTDAGCVRSANQDRVLHDDELGLYIVCDGLGGPGRGEIAAEMAIGVIRQYVEASTDPRDVTWPFGYNPEISCAANRLSTAVRLANRHVWRRSEEALAFLGMGTTISAVLIDRSLAAIANIGDSRVYLIRGDDMSPLTVDDTIAATAGVAGAALGWLEDIPVQKILTRAAGSQETTEVAPRECVLQDGDLLLLCSDGLHGCISDGEIRETVAGGRTTPEESALRLLNRARAAGAPDNVSVVVVAWAA